MIRDHYRLAVTFGYGSYRIRSRRVRLERPTHLFLASRLALLGVVAEMEMLEH